MLDLKKRKIDTPCGTASAKIKKNKCFESSENQKFFNRRTFSNAQVEDV